MTSAPRRYASSAIARPIRPLDRVVSTRTSSTVSRQDPLVTSTRRPASGLSSTARSASSTITSVSAIFARPSSMRGGTTVTPSAPRRARFSATALWRYMVSCMAGTTTTGMPLPSAVVAKVVTGVSSMPHAILPTVFAVQGATRRRSACPSSPHQSTCSTSPVIAVIAGRPVAVRECVGADDTGGRAREDGLDRGPASSELVGEPDGLDGRDRARDGEHDLLSFECLDCHRITRSWTV